jgi:sugar phosphate isomerase/epimerase
MKLGFITAILENYSYEQMMDFAAAEKFECVEVACWPKGKGERRYAGTSHIDVVRVMEDDAYANHIIGYAKLRNIEISSLAFYPNTLDPDPEKRAANIAHINKMIEASAKLGVGMITTFIGRDQTKTVEANLELVREVWPPIIEKARDLGVKVAIENCPMLFGPDQWPGGQNLMTTPANWRRIFEILPYDNFGINYDPSHFVWQMIDYIKPLYEFRDKIFHVHYKDIKVYPEKLQEVGIMGYPLDFMSPKLPGLGDVDWGKYVSALTDIGYTGYTCIEIEDKAFEANEEAVLNSLRLSRKFLKNYVI